ncbi:FadR/GntR family transcriptional regulator [Catenovulum maritimum]|uniref:GntR family transcriptional regulator n=1 Tax=Catenovulum maritimum TaxID=1513271 RepID=A0A0J8H0U3_9ALTE|nr:FadR/GntR family transcriptional regulator [Catenovulum maritimum]KMT67069.1 GntR family transcriptional regulator [Catenovulum maritimum]
MQQAIPNLNYSWHIAHELGKSIVSGTYDQSGGLPTEAVLCSEFGISRSAMREAIKMLSAKGMIISRPRQGIRILPQDQWNIFDRDVLKWILDSKPSLTLLKEFLQVRLAIEPEAASLAAQHATPELIQQIKHAMRRLELAHQGLDDVLESDIAFHESILYASKNRFFVQLREFVKTALNVSIRYTNLLKGVKAGDLDDHHKILTAIMARDAAAAREATAFIIQEALILIDEALESTA